MLQHRHLALLVHFVAPGLFASLAIEEIDEHRLPVQACELKHQGSLVGVTGFGETMQLVVGHG